MKRCLVGLFLLTLALGGFVSAAQDQPRRAEPSLSGTVISSGDISFAIRTDDGTVKTFLLPTTASVPSGGFRPGDRVSVSYQPLDEARSLATGVAFVAPNETAAPAPLAAARTVDASETSDDVWRTVLLVGLLGTTLALAVTTLASLLRSPRDGHRHTTA